MTQRRRVDWLEGAWTHNEHALVAPLADGEAVEVVFTAGVTEQFDQAGVFVVVDDRTWVKAGVEFVDGAPQVGAVVTAPRSDWSVRPVPDWADSRVRVRVSRSGGALTVRAGLDGADLQLVRVAPFPAEAPVRAGPLCCAPTRSGLRVRFHEWTLGPADEALHP